MKSTFVKSMLLTAAFAISSFAGTVTIHVPFAFIAAGKTMPAGDYSVTKNSAGVLVMIGETPNASVLMMTRDGEVEKTDKPGVTFTGTTLSSIRMADGKMLELVNASK